MSEWFFGPSSASHATACMSCCSLLFGAAEWYTIYYIFVRDRLHMFELGCEPSVLWWTPNFSKRKAYAIRYVHVGRCYFHATRTDSKMWFGLGKVRFIRLVWIADACIISSVDWSCYSIFFFFKFMLECIF